MSAGTTFSAGDVLLADVTYTDESREKRRPLLVVSTEAYSRATDHVVFVPITSAPQPMGDHQRVQMAVGSLPFDSNVVLDRIQTLRQTRVVKKFGRVTPDLLSKALRSVHRLLATP